MSCICYFQTSTMHFIHQLPDPASGASRFSDGVNAAKELKDTNPVAFDMLSQYPIQFIDSGIDLVGDYHMESWHYPIRCVANSLCMCGMWPLVQSTRLVQLVLLCWLQELSLYSCTVCLQYFQKYKAT